MNRGYRKAHKQKLRRERIRLEKHQSRMERAQSGPELPLRDDLDKTEDLPRPFPHFTSERFFRELDELKGDRVFESAEELNVFLSEVQSKQLHLDLRKTSTNPKFQAEMIAYDAMESEDIEESIKLAREALEIDPLCVQALTIAANDPRHSEQRKVTDLRHAIEVGEAELGPDFREKYKDQFWKDHETRPYMRALFDLAMALQGSGKRAEAVAELEGILALDPDDALGVRDILMGTYMLTSDREGQRRLLDIFGDGFWGMFSWGRVFYEWNGGDRERAREALARARAQNPYVEPYLTGAKPLPEHLPASYAPKQPSEAQQIAFFTALAWLETPGIGAWLLQEKSAAASG